jgi:hypothetical protein
MNVLLESVLLDSERALLAFFLPESVTAFRAMECALDDVVTIDECNFLPRTGLVVQAGTHWDSPWAVEEHRPLAIEALRAKRRQDAVFALTAGEHDTEDDVPALFDEPEPTVIDDPEPLAANELVPPVDSDGPDRLMAESVTICGPDPGPPPPALPRRSWLFRHLGSIIGFATVVAILVFGWYTRNPYLGMAVVFAAILAVAVQRFTYKYRMEKLAHGVIAEAEYVKRCEPDAYPQYFDEATLALKDHGVGRYAALLPTR